MTAVTFVALILPGMDEAWRRFIQEMRDLHGNEYDESRRRAGITEEAIWLVESASAAWIIVHLEAMDPSAALKELTSSELPFDQWYRDQFRALHGLDLSRLFVVEPHQPIFKWHVVES